MEAVLAAAFTAEAAAGSTVEAVATGNFPRGDETMKRETINTFSLWLQRAARRARAAATLAILGMSTITGVGLAQQSVQSAFPSALEASKSLFDAVQGNREQDITNILGGPSELASSRDDAQDQVDRQLFVEKYQEMHRLGRDPDGTVTLYIGAENWPFPIPLVQKNGAWRFDPDAGSQEVLFRRIGDNEFTAIAICHEFATNEKQYRASPSTANPPDKFPASMLAKVADNSISSDPVLFHGYYFRVLATRATASGSKNNGFVFIAYPSEYRSSGVMTFFVTGNGVVYEKDLGAKTSGLVTALTTFHKDASWHAADH
jgi:hypothetical protein